ncbi:HIT-like protein [Coprinopsis marcescibilis]|uniref:HIT-like protein n=1 Tax=Coprinopsis marcescibilis TaxID=230819 RepID=A0A5C3KQF7_COPMA|nr:HIT-like protein [Coprinopsis marcescibilis]
MTCIFCGILDRPERFKIIWQSEELVAFEDYRPAAKHHILICPKRHVESVRTMSREDVPLLKAMEKAGIDLFDRFNVPEKDRRMGFHIPPFNSVNHLHLHLHALPYKSTLHAMKYPGSPTFGSYNKGLTWFVEIRQAISILDSGRKVGVLPC